MPVAAQCTAHLDHIDRASDDQERHVLAIDHAEPGLEHDLFSTDGSRVRWSREGIIRSFCGYFEHHGRAPSSVDGDTDAALPNREVVGFYFGSWRRALVAANLPVPKKARTPTWDRETVRCAICEWMSQHGRAPGDVELEEDPFLPPPAVLQRILETNNPHHMLARVNRLCADAGCRHTWTAPLAPRPDLHVLGALDRAAEQFLAIFPRLVYDTERVSFGGAYLTRTEAEDVVVEAWIVFERRAREGKVSLDEPIGGWLNRAATLRAKGTLERRLRTREKSLDAIRGTPEESQDNLRLLIDPTAESGLDRLLIAEMLAEVEDLRNRGLSRDEIMAEMGIPARRTFEVRHVVNRAQIPSTIPSPYEAWSPKRVIDALRKWAAEEGRPPSYGDASGAPGLPSTRAVKVLFGSWNNALRTAGLQTRNNGRSYTDKEIIEIVCGWYHKHGRVWKVLELKEPPEFPSYATLRLRFGTGNPGRVVEIARERCAKLHDGACPHALATAAVG
jgi:hypothetical protein